VTRKYVQKVKFLPYYKPTQVCRYKCTKMFGEIVLKELGKIIP